jgi:hypothetical protein
MQNKDFHFVTFTDFADLDDYLQSTADTTFAEELSHVSSSYHYICKHTDLLNYA